MLDIVQYTICCVDMILVSACIYIIIYIYVLSFLIVRYSMYVPIMIVNVYVYFFLQNEFKVFTSPQNYEEKVIGKIIEFNESINEVH